MPNFSCARTRPPSASARPGAQRDRIALDRDVDVEVRLAEQDVPDGAADEVDAVVGLAHRGDRLEDRLRAARGARARAGRLGATSRRLVRRPERAEHVAAGDDADEPVASRTATRPSAEARRGRCTSASGVSSPHVTTRELMIPLTGACERPCRSPCRDPRADRRRRAGRPRRRGSRSARSAGRRPSRAATVSSGPTDARAGT